MRGIFAGIAAIVVAAILAWWIVAPAKRQHALPNTPIAQGIRDSAPASPASSPQPDIVAPPPEPVKPAPIAVLPKPRPRHVEPRPSPTRPVVTAAPPTPAACGLLCTMHGVLNGGAIDYNRDRSNDR